MNTLRLIPRMLWWSPVKYLVPVLVGIETAALLNQGMRWRGEWAWTVDWVGGSVFLLGPVVSGIAAWRASASLARLGEAADVVANPRRATVAELVGVIGWAWICHVAGLAVALGISAGSGAAGLPGLLPLLPQLLIIAGFAGLGALLGALVPNPLMAPLTTVVLLVCTTQFASGALPSLWVTVGGATTSLAGLRYDPAVLATQTVFGLALLLLGVSVRRSATGPLQVHRTLAVVPLVAVLATGTWLAGTGSSRIEPDPRPVALACGGSDPVVCVRPESTAAGAPLEHTFHALAEAAHAAGVAHTPQRFEQVVAAQPNPKGARAFVLNPGAVVGQDVDAPLVVHYFVFNRACLTSDVAPPAEAMGRLDTVGLLLAVKAHFVDPAQINDLGLKALLAMAPDAQADLVGRALAASDSCRFADVPRLP